MITIEAADMAIPRKVMVTLECEDTHDFFCRGSETFCEDGGYIAAHSKAIEAGWLERQTEEGRAWVCPRCSGKVSG